MQRCFFTLMLIASWACVNGQRLFTIDVGSKSRSYLMESHYDTDSPTLFIVFHGQGENVLRFYSQRKKWDSLPSNTIVVFPNAVAGEWPCEDSTQAGVTLEQEAQFVNRLIERHIAEYNLHNSPILILNFNEGRCITEALRGSLVYQNLKFYTLEENNGSRQDELLLFIRRIQALRGYVEKDRPEPARPLPSALNGKDQGYFRSRIDSVAFFEGHIIPNVQLRFSTIFPLTVGGGLEFSVNRFTSVYLNYGKLFNPYIQLLFDRIESNADQNQSQLEFIRSNYTGGRVWTVGSNAHYARWYLGGFFQFQKFTLQSTPRTIVENLAPDRAEEIANRAANSLGVVENFYNNGDIKPAAYPLQLGVQVGKRFLFRTAPQFSIGIEAGYSFNIGVKGKIDSRNGPIGNFLNNIAGPVINERLEERFEKVRIPSLSLSLIYNFGYTGDY